MSTRSELLGDAARPLIRRKRQVTAHLILLCGSVFLLTPIVLIVLSSTHESLTLQRDGLQWTWGSHATQNYAEILHFESGFFNNVTPLRMLWNSLTIALSVALLTTIFSLLTAYVVVFFEFPAKTFVFWLVLLTLLFPLESRFVTTFQVTSIIGLVNTHAGIVLPALAFALGTFFFRQHLLTLPDELIEAAILDGAGPTRVLIDIVIPLSTSRAGAIFVIAFMIGWNQYLWPLIISTDDSLYTLVRGIRLIGAESGPGMALIVLTILPPFVLLLMFQRWFFSSLSGKSVQSG